jgi:hypothetical protein
VQYSISHRAPGFIGRCYPSSAKQARAETVEKIRHLDENIKKLIREGMVVEQAKDHVLAHGFSTTVARVDASTQDIETLPDLRYLSIGTTGSSTEIPVPLDAVTVQRCL